MDLRGLPAKAWVLRLADMVKWRWDRAFVVRALRGKFLQRGTRGELNEEDRRKSISLCFGFHRLRNEFRDESVGETSAPRQLPNLMTNGTKSAIGF